MSGMPAVTSSMLCNENCQALMNIKGSVCEKCYTKKYLSARPNSEKCYRENTELLSSSIIPTKQLPFINAALCRLESFGDITNATHLHNYINLIRKNSHCTFSLFTKNYTMVFNYFKEHKQPRNLSIVFSSLMLNTPFDITPILQLGLTNVKLHINSIGCKECRPTYREELVKYFKAREDKLCDTCRERLLKNPLRLLDCKNPDCAEIAKTAPKTTEHLCQDCEGKFELLKSALDAMKIDYVVDSSIVRGLDYYTGVVFEFIAEGIGAQSTVCGGGRYDGLVESIGGPKLSGIGFAMGITRIILAMRELGLDNIESENPKLYVAALGDKALIKALEITERLRKDGKYAECDILGRSLKAQMKYANKIGAEYTLIIGDSEIEAGRAQLKCMADGEQREVELDSFTI